MTKKYYFKQQAGSLCQRFSLCFRLLSSRLTALKFSSGWTKGVGWWSDWIVGSDSEVLSYSKSFHLHFSARSQTQQQSFYKFCFNKDVKAVGSCCHPQMKLWTAVMWQSTDACDQILVFSSIWVINSYIMNIKQGVVCSFPDLLLTRFKALIFLFFLSSAVYILLGAGGLMMIVGFFGCFGAVRESQCLLASVG